MYLSAQKNCNLNWIDNQQHQLLESQQISIEHSKEILTILYDQFPITEKVSETIARLPLCSYYDEEVINKVCDSVLEYFGL